MNQTTDTVQEAGIGPASAPEQPTTTVSEGVVSGEFSADLAPEGHLGPWVPTTIRDVEWALERIGEAEADIAEVEAQLAAALSALQARAEAITSKAQRKADWFRSLVETWAVANRDQVVRGKSKSRELLGGSVSFRAAPEKVVVVDEARLLRWAETDHLDLVRVRTEVDKKALDAFVKGTGEIPPGVGVVAAGEKVSVKASPLPTLPAGKAVLP